MNDSISELFGKPISVYTRTQAIADGVLVDVSNVLERCPFKYPVATTRAAYEATLAAGGRWVPNQSPAASPEEMADAGIGATERLELPGGQDIRGRLHDIFQMMFRAMRAAKGPTSRIDFEVLVDTHGNGRHSTVELHSICGPGDDMEPVLTILLRGED